MAGSRIGWALRGLTLALMLPAAAARAAGGGLAVEPGTCPGDTNGDAVADVTDLVNVVLEWDASGGTADVNGDGLVDVDDLVLVILNWGPCPLAEHRFEPGPSETLLTEPRGCGDGDADRSCVTCPRCPPGTERVAHGVQGFSGGFDHRSVDLDLSGRCQGVIIGRVHRSVALEGAGSAVGASWDLSWSQRLVPHGPDIVLCDGNGRQDLYVADGVETWTRREFFRTLHRETDGTFTLRFADTGEWGFNAFDHPVAPGRIHRAVDRNGNGISLAHDAEGRVQTIVDTLDREIAFTYDGAGRVAEITDWAGRAVAYEHYDDGDAGGSAGDLKSVRTPPVIATPDFPIPPGHEFPEGKTTVYTYTTGYDDARLNHMMLTINDPKGQTHLRNEYAHTIDETDPRHTTDAGNLYYRRLVRQIRGENDEVIDFVYERLDPAPANNSAGLRAIVNDRVGNVEAFYYDGDNRLVMHREYTGRWPDDEPTFDTGEPPIPRLRVDDPAFYETRYFYNDDSLLTRVVRPNGNEELFIYDGDNPDRRAQGNLLEHCFLPGPLGGDQVQRCEQFEYDDGFGGCCGTNYVTLHRDFRGHETVHEYDEHGNRVHTQHRLPSIVEDFEYNEHGQLTRHVHPDNGSGHRRVDVYRHYDRGPQRGYLHLAIVDHPHDGPDDPPDPPDVTGHFELTTTYEYNVAGVLIRMIDPRGRDTRFTVNQLDQTVVRTSREVLDGTGVRYDRITYYDANDNVVRVDRPNFDPAGRPVAGGTPFVTVIHEYDVLNFVTRTCEEATAFEAGADQRDCSGLPQTHFVVTEHEYDANRNRTIVRHGEATEGDQPDNADRALYDERDLLFRRERAYLNNILRSTTQYDYDGNGNLVRITGGLEAAGDPAYAGDAPRLTIRAYDGYDRLTALTDPMGNVTEYHYDPNGNVGGNRVPGEANPFGVRVLGELVDEEGSSGNVRLREMTCEYDPMDRMTREIGAFFETGSQAPVGDGEAATEYEYTDDSQVRLVRNDNGHESLTAYDTAGRVVLTTDPSSNTLALEYDGNGNVVSIVEVERSDVPGAPDETFTTTYAYDGLDRLISTTDSAGNGNQFSYDSRDNRIGTVDANGNVVLHAYDGLNRPIFTGRLMTDDGTGQGNPIPGISTFQTWDDSSRLIRRTDHRGNATDYVYGPRDNTVQIVHADLTIHDYRYDVHDNLVLVDDANQTEVSCRFDLNDRLVRKDVLPGPGVAADVTFENHAWDGLSRLVATGDDDSSLARSYDSLSRVTAETLNGLTTAASYDGLGNQVQCVYPGGRTIDRTFDELERVKVIADGMGFVAGYDYVGPARVARRDYGNGTRCEYAYDGISGVPNPPGDFGVKRIVGTTHTGVGDGAVLDGREYRWDPMGNKTRRADVRAGGPQLAHGYAYDSLYRLNGTVVIDGGGATVRETGYNLDGASNRTYVRDDAQQGAYLCAADDPAPADCQLNQYTYTPGRWRAYDENGNLVTIGSCTPEQNVDRLLVEFDGPCPLAPVEVSAATARVAAHFEDGRFVVTELDPFMPSGAQPVAQMCRTIVPGDHYLTELDLGWSESGPEETLNVRLELRAGSTLVARVGVLDLDEAGPPVTRVEIGGVTRNGSEPLPLEGTAACRLEVEMTGPGTWHVIASIDGRVLLEGDVADAVDELRVWVRRKASATFGLVTLDRVLLQPIGEPAPPVEPPGSPLAQISYDYRNRMVAYDDLEQGRLSTYSYDPLGRRIERVADATGTPQTTRYFYDGWQVCEERDGAGIEQATYVYGRSIDQVLEMARGGSRFYYHADDLGNVMGVSDAAGVMVERYDYGDYGVPLILDGRGSPQPESAIGNPYLFTGRRYDGESGLYYARHRYLDPARGRFTTRDPIGIWGDGMHLGNGFAYAASNPFTYVDPDGLSTKEIVEALMRLPGRELSDLLLRNCKTIEELRVPEFVYKCCQDRATLIAKLDRSPKAKRSHLENHFDLIDTAKEMKYEAAWADFMIDLVFGAAGDVITGLVTPNKLKLLKTVVRLRGWSRVQKVLEKIEKIDDLKSKFDDAVKKGEKISEVGELLGELQKIETAGGLRK